MFRRLLQHKVERSSSSHAILEATSRKRKAAKIQALLSEVTDFGKAKVLDIGTGSGDIAHELSKKAKKVVSIDLVDERKQKKGYVFKLVKDESLPFKNDSFDIVVTNHVVEHTPNQKKHLREATRVLKPGGYIYLATPNKYWLSDPHYKLPFISWLPRKVSQSYLQLFQKTEWDIYPLSALGVKKYLTALEVTNALPLLLRSSASTKLDTWSFFTKICKHLPYQVLNLTQYFSPTLIYLIRKKKS